MITAIPRDGRAWIGRTVTFSVTALLLVACSSGTPGTSGAPGVPAISAPALVPTAPAASSTTTAAIDPCAILTIPDVQPFFSVPIATQLHAALPGTCEWSANDAPGGVSTAMDVGIMTGQDALDVWTIADQPGGNQTNFSGVGDKAEHFPGDPDFVSIKGDVLCKITTFGIAHLAGRMNYDPTAIPDTAATAIAQSYGTLCNRIYGSGPTTPAITAPPVAAGPASTPGRSGRLPAVGGTFGTDLPLPAGLDCTGHVSTDISGATVCDAMTSGDPFAVYPFYLDILPKDGFAIHHQTETTDARGREQASILFGGKDIGDLSTINVHGPEVVITLQQP